MRKERSNLSKRISRLNKRYEKDSCFVENLIQCVAEEFKIWDFEVLRDSNLDEYMPSKRCFSYLLRKKWYGYARIADICKVSNHSTIIYRVRICLKMIETDPSFKKKVLIVEEKLNNRINNI